MAVRKTNGWLEEYHRQVTSGEIIVCAAIKVVLAMLMAGLNDERYYYDTTDADLRIDFIENCIRLTKSPFYGKPMKLTLWQKAIISVLYGFKMTEDGTDRFQILLLLIARKNGKSEFCSALLLAELVVGNWGSDIVCASNDDSQADILYQATDTMRLMIDPRQLDTWRNQRWIRNKITNSKIFKLSDKMKNKEGRNIDVAVADEVHEIREKSPALINAIEQSQSAKINPKFIVITTEGFTNEGYLDELLRYARSVLAGEIEGLDVERFLPFLFEQDDEQEIWQDRASWVKSNPGLGEMKQWSFLDRQVDKARNKKSERPFVLTKDFNVKQNTAEAWLMESDYDYECAFDVEDFRGALCIGAVDLAATTDLACAKVLLMKPEDKRKFVHSMYFVPESKLHDSDDKNAGAEYEKWAREGRLTVCPGNEVEIAAVADWFFSLYKDYGLRPFITGYDQRFAKDFLKRMDEYGFETEMVWQNAATLSNAAKLVEAELLDQHIYYDNNPLDKWCFGNSAIITNNAAQILVVKIAGQPNRRIDGAVTLVILLEMFRRYRSEFISHLSR